MEAQVFFAAGFQFVGVLSLLQHSGGKAVWQLSGQREGLSVKYYSSIRYDATANTTGRFLNRGPRVRILSGTLLKNYAHNGFSA